MSRSLQNFEEAAGGAKAPSRGAKRAREDEGRGDDDMEEEYGGSRSLAGPVAGGFALRVGEVRDVASESKGRTDKVYQVKLVTVDDAGKPLVSSCNCIAFMIALNKLKSKQLPVDMASCKHIVSVFGVEVERDRLDRNAARGAPAAPSAVAAAAPAAKKCSKAAPAGAGSAEDAGAAAAATADDNPSVSKKVCRPAARPPACALAAPPKEAKRH